MTAKSLWQSQRNLLLCFSKLQKDQSFVNLTPSRLLTWDPKEYGLLIYTQRAKNIFLSNFLDLKAIGVLGFCLLSYK